MLGLKRIEKPFELDPWSPGPSSAQHLFLRTPFSSYVKEWEVSLRKKLADARTLPMNGESAFNLAKAADDLELATARGDTTSKASGILTGKIGEYADIGMRVEGRGELGGAWTQYKPCDPGLQLTCNPSLFPQLKPEMQFGVIVGGTISDRVHVNVDYDQRREFDAANNINVFYQGLEDEILQRVEVGDVSIALPASRYLTQGIPSGNFGFKAMGQIGPLAFQTVFAQQRGDVTTRDFKLGGLGAGQKLEQDAQLVIDDADYVEGQFFYIVHPDSIRNAPHIDALALRASDVPARLRPAAGVSIQVYRDERPTLTNPQQQAQLGYFLAEGTSGAVKHSGLFRRLLPDQYTIHSSGLWIMLRAPLRADEALAISYITEDGDTVGTINAENTPANQTARLQLLRGPVSRHQPGQATWDYELHNVYRLDSSSNVDPTTIDLRISLGEIAGGRTFKDVGGGPVSLLRLFGLDEDSPVDVVDPAQIYQPGRDAFGTGSTGAGSTASAPSITGTFIIFPTTKPFSRPTAVPSARLTENDVRVALGPDLNAAIYDNADPVVRDGAGRFRLNFKYRLNVEGMVSTFNLGAFGIREGSERIFVGEKQLTNGTDYTIDYDIGQLTLTDAAGLFSTNPDAQIRATWEQKAIFQVAPTSVFGLNARYGLGTRGELNIVGLYQAEKTLMARPQLGLEPGAIMLGGVSGRIDMGGLLIDRMLSKIPGLRVGSQSAMTLTGELALSVPNPNTRGDAYLDDFEATDEIPLPMSRRRWFLGSRPESTEHASSVLPFPLDANTAAALVWQHDVFQDGNVTGSLLPRQQIDRQIVVAGNELPESVMWLTLGDSIPNSLGKRWRSMTTVLSTTGRDMTRSEYLEFYVRSSAAPGQTLVIDLGNVSEDAFYFDANRRTNGSYTDGTQWGLGQFDQEVRLANREVFSKDKDERGLWAQICSANLQQQYALGDPNANCARNNGEPDTEDLDANGVLDASDQAYFRYVIPIDDASPYLVRNTAATGTNFRLFRVPLRTQGRPVNGASDATWRFVKHLRMTIASSPTRQENFVLARMRIVGSRWTKRDVHGIMQGAVDDESSPTGAQENLQVGPVSLLTDPAYVPPVGIGNELQDPSQRFGGGGIEFNEKSLRMTYNGVAPGDRAEVYFRYAQQPQGMMNYRQLRLWAIARQGSWGENGSMRLHVKLGNDPRNFYLFQSKLRAPSANALQPSDWLPELVIEFDEWFKLRQKADELLAQNPPPPGQQLTLWSADSTYAIVLEDRARAPNLAALRELSFAVYNAGSAFGAGEVWINDMRLDAAFRDPGVAGTMAMEIRGGDFLSANITYSNQGAVFRQLNQDVRYMASGDFSVASTAQLGNFLPGGWGVDVPLSVTHSRAGFDPTFLEGSDVRAAGLQGLRDTNADATRVNVSIRKRTPSANPIIGLLVDGLALRAGYNTANNSAITTRSENSGFDGGLSYSRDLRPRTLNVTPTLVDGILRAIMPARLEQSDFFRRLSNSQLRWAPQRISFGSSYYQQERRSYQFNGILVVPGDSAIRPIESPRKGLQNDATIAFSPFQPLLASVTFRSARDLLDARRSSNRFVEQSAIDAARNQLGGLDIGWETDRQIASEIAYRPEIAAWLKPSFNYSARFGTDRNPSYLEVNAVDSTGQMQRRYQADRTMGKGLLFDPAVFVSSMMRLPQDATVPDSVIAQRGIMGRTTYRLARSVLPVELNWNSTLGSQFERELNGPRMSYQFGLGDIGAYRLIGGDTAIYVNARDAFSARSGLRLPGNATLNTSFERNTLDAIDQRGGTRAENERRWPIANLTWNRLPLPSMLAKVLTSSTIALNHATARRTSLLGGSLGQDRGGVDHENGGRLTLIFPAGVTANYSLNARDGTSKDPTGDAEQTSTRHDVQLNGTFFLPESFSARLKAPITVTVGFTQDAQRQCRFRQTFGETTTAQECVPFIDFRNRAMNLNFQTIITDVTVGTQLSYTSRQSFVGTRNGNNQFQLMIFGEFNMTAGRSLTGNNGGIR